MTNFIEIKQKFITVIVQDETNRQDTINTDLFVVSEHQRKGFV